MFLPKLNRVVPGFALLSLMLGGCSDETTDPGIDEVGDGDGDGTGDADADADDTSTSEDTSEPEPAEQYPAMGISITTVEANQGTAVFIGEGGEWVPGADRLAPLVKNRDTLIRVHYEVDSSFTPRQIEARLILAFPDGTTTTRTQIRDIVGPSQPNTLQEIFYFGLVADQGDVTPGVTYQVELHELEPGAGVGEIEGVWQTPAEPGEIGVQPEPLEIKIVFVPYHHLYENIDRVTDTSDATMKILADALYEQNPIEALIWEVHEPVLWELPMDNLGSVLGPLSALRDNEMAFPNVYYHALFPVPNGGVAGVAGVASVPGDGKGEGESRVAVSALGNSPNNTAGTVVHEVGHNQGLQHVFCPFAAAASPDPSYPYQNGLLGTWGFGLISFNLYSPENHYDYMSYCGPSWVSRWSWTKTFNRARTLSSWDYEDTSDGGLDLALGPVGYEEKSLLIGSITGDDTEFWWTAHGSLPSDADVYGDDYEHYVELRSDGELVALLPAIVRYTNDYSTAWLTSELPDGLEKLEGVDEIVRFDDAQQGHSIPRSRVQLSRR
jgi:hypothetical protein